MKTPSIHKHIARKGFTLAELLVGMMVGSIILSAVATLAFALSSAQEATDNMSEKKAVLRFTTFRISDLIKYSNQLQSASVTQLDFWADDNADGIIDVSEQFSIKTDASANSLIISDQQGDFTLLADCYNVQFLLDAPVPGTGLVSIMFDLTEEGTEHNYQIRAALRGSTEHYAGGG
jgi:prepilin-type N-terminal cleavage/methylation domain-containing protein